MTPFGARLRTLREERGLTLTRMAADLGLQLLRAARRIDGAGTQRLAASLDA